MTVPTLPDDELPLHEGQDFGEQSTLASGGFEDVLADDVPVSIGRFTVLGKLGEGGMGVVYLGFDDRLARKVAIKLLPSELA